MEHRDIVLTAVFGVRDGGFPGTGKPKDREDKIFLFIPLKGVSFEASVAGSVAVSNSRTPSKRQGSLFYLAKITHTQYGRAVLFRRKDRQPIGVIGVRPVRIDKNKDVRIGNLS